MSPLSHHQILRQCAQLIPPLSRSLHKGEAGRVGVLGGSKDYAGAPTFAAMAALRLGSDLAHIICDKTAGAVIKTFSPDLIVHTDLSEESTQESTTELFKSLLPRLHTLVIGPGLGRSEYMQDAARIAIRLARERSVYIVIDADGLYLIQTEPELIKNYKRCVITPNVVEFARLCDSLGVDRQSNPETLAARLSRTLGGVTVLQKGESDIITNGEEILINEEEGSVRRCGGQGDVLSGSVGTFLAWGKNYEEGVGKDEKDLDRIEAHRIPLLAAYAACSTTRHASKLTFGRMKRAMQTSDMLNDVGPSFEAVFGESETTESKL